MDVQRKNDAIKNCLTYENPSETIRGSVKKRVTITEKKTRFSKFKPGNYRLNRYYN